MILTFKALCFTSVSNLIGLSPEEPCVLDCSKKPIEMQHIENVCWNTITNNQDKVLTTAKVLIVFFSDIQSRSKQYVVW